MAHERAYAWRGKRKRESKGRTPPPEMNKNRNSGPKVANAFAAATYARHPITLVRMGQLCITPLFLFTHSHQPPTLLLAANPSSLTA